MQFEYDPERLIQEVKKRPGIWDYGDAEYRARNIRSDLWKEVVNELMHSDVKITKSEMRELELQLQKKWKSIRDSYQKYIQNPNRTRRPYIYTKQLNFLSKKMQPQSPQAEAGASSESDDTGSSSKRKNLWKQTKLVKLAKEDQSSEEEIEDSNTMDHFDNDDATNCSHDDAIYPEVPVVDKGTKPSEFVFASVDSPKDDNDDSDKMFLLSLLPHLKAIPKPLRLNAKMDLMQVLRNASYGSNNDQKIF